MLLMIDNYDSFTYNLVQYFGELGEEVNTIRNDEMDLDAILALKPDKIVISPGPSNPDHAGVSMQVVNQFAGKVPILGVCLGHQCIGQVFGGKIKHAQQVMHGKTSKIHHIGKGVFMNIDNPFTVTRYHSLVVDKDSIPSSLEVTAWTQDNEIMGIQHKELPIYGVQFHPESILTDYGHQLLNNFLQMRV